MRGRAAVGSSPGYWALHSNDGNADPAYRSFNHSHNVGTIAGNSGTSHTHGIPAQTAGQQWSTPNTGTGVVPRDASYVGHAHGGDTTGIGSAHTHAMSGKTETDHGLSQTWSQQFPNYSLNFIIRAT
jgi:hypothetical protein